jgi:hypothetical protein
LIINAQKPGELLLRLPFHPQLIKSPIRLNTDMVDWLNGCKYGFIPYLQNNWTLHFSIIGTFLNYYYDFPDQPFNQ